MAEVVGAVSGGAGLLSLAIQLGDCAFKLKGFCERVKDARTTLADLSHDLQTVSLTLQELERHRQRDTHDVALLERCASRCQEKADQISGLVGKLDANVRKLHLAGKAYVALKRSEVLELLQELEQAKSSIMLALQMYSLSCQAKRDEEHSTQLENLQAENAANQAALLQQLGLLTVVFQPRGELLESISSSTTGAATNANNEQSRDSWLQKRSSKAYLRKGYQATRDFSMRISFAAWLTGRIWHVATSRSESGWTCGIHTWHVVPWMSPIFSLCHAGDIRGVQMLLSLGEASLMDCNEYGQSLLDVAAREGHTDLCRFLLQQIRYPDHETVLWNALWLFSVFAKTGLNTAVPMYRLFVEESGIDVDLSNDVTDKIFYCSSDLECVRILQRNQSVPYSSLPSSARIKRALTRGLFGVPSPEILLLHAGEPTMSQELATFVADGFTALHVAAKGMVDVLIGRGNSTLISWIQFAQGAIIHGADLSALVNGKTPLLHGLRYILMWNSKWSVVNEFLQLWADLVSGCGRDLTQYVNSERWQLERVKMDKFIWMNRVMDIDDLFIGDEPEWSIKIVRTANVNVYDLDFLPGCWNEDASLTTRTIIWKPSQQESEEGHWRFRDSVTLRSDPIDFRSMAQALEKEPFIDYLKDSQDDAGPIALRACVSKDRGQIRRRCSSQPAPTRRRELAYYDDFYDDFHDSRRSRRSRRRRPRWRWCHLCPFDNRWRLDCEEDGAFSLRNCLRGVSSFTNTIHESWRWCEYSIERFRGDFL